MEKGNEDSSLYNRGNPGFEGESMTKREKDLHVHRWYNKPKIWKRLKNFGLALAATAVIGSCESCIPNLQPIPPQITLSAQESSVKKDNPARLNNDFPSFDTI